MTNVDITAEPCSDFERGGPGDYVASEAFPPSSTGRESNSPMCYR